MAAFSKDSFAFPSASDLKVGEPAVATDAFIPRRGLGIGRKYRIDDVVYYFHRMDKLITFRQIIC